MVQEFLAALEASGLGHAARNTVWLYPLANLAHVLGAALLVGSIAVFDVLVLQRSYPQATAAGTVAIPLAASGVALQAVSGVVLFAAEATAIAGNPAFLVKVALLVVGLANVAAFHAYRRATAVAVEDRGVAVRLHAMLSLGVWIAVLLAGRTIAYL